MKLEIASSRKINSRALAQYAVRRLQFALDRFRARIRRVRLRLTDQNGPRGGLDKKCLVTVTLPKIGTIAVESKSGDAYSAVDLVAETLKHRVASLIERSRTRDRRNVVRHQELLSEAEYSAAYL